jgi:putative ABC transport system permease protein
MDWAARIRHEYERLRKQVDDGVVEELAQHAAAAFEAARADGESADDAAARVRTLVTSWCAATNGPRRIDRTPLLRSAPAGRSVFSGLGLDVRNAIRLIRRQPGYALASMAMIALGITATTTIFTVVNGVLLRPLPWPNADRIVRVFESREGDARTAAQRLFTNVPYQQWSDHPQTIEGLGGWQESTLRFAADAGGDTVPAAQVSVSLFPLLGVAPFIGANFTPKQELTDDTVLLSYGMWQDRFGGDPTIVGKSVQLGGKARIVVGVMPAGFWFPFRATRAWTP